MDQAIIEKERVDLEALREHEILMKALQDKIGAQNISELEVAVKQSAEAKQKALDDFCVDICSRDAIDKAQADFESAETALARAKELQAVIARKGKEHFEKFGKLTNTAQRATQAAWSAIASDLVSEMPEDAAKSIALAFAANQRSLRPLPFAVFLEGFLKAPTREELTKINQELDLLKSELTDELGKAAF